MPCSINIADDSVFQLHQHHIFCNGAFPRIRVTRADSSKLAGSEQEMIKGVKKKKEEEEVRSSGGAERSCFSELGACSVHVLCLCLFLNTCREAG